MACGVLSSTPSMTSLDETTPQEEQTNSSPASTIRPGHRAHPSTFADVNMPEGPARALIPWLRHPTLPPTPAASRHSASPARRGGFIETESPNHLKIELGR